MPDPRFYDAATPASLAELAELSHARLATPGLGGRCVAAVAPLSQAAESDVAFITDRRYVAELRATGAGACFCLPVYVDAAPLTCAVLVTDEPQAAYAAAALRLHRPKVLPPDAPAIDPTAELEAGVVVGRGAVIGAGVRIGAASEIGVNSVIGPGVCIGRGCRIGANVSITFALIGDRVRILSGAVVGEAGFGVAGSRAGAVDIPQLGRVILQDDVSLGACACVDRGAYDDTVVGERTKIDNLVQIAHNVKLGRNCVLAAHTGLSGSVTVGDGAMFGGRAGIADHLDIGAGAKIAAAAGVMKDVPDGETWCGTPARPLRRFMRETAWLARNAAKREEG